VRHLDKYYIANNICNLYQDGAPILHDQHETK